MKNLNEEDEEALNRYLMITDSEEYLDLPTYLRKRYNITREDWEDILEQDKLESEETIAASFVREKL